jgi:uncharacterized protein (DUF2147 family)
MSTKEDSTQLVREEARMKSRIVRLILGVLLVGGAAQAADNDAVLGKWITQNGKSTVEIFSCGAKLCGKIVALKNPLYTDSTEGPVGTAKVDRKNPDMKLRKRPLLGLQIMEGFVAGGNSAWGDGTIYDADSGKTYKCKMKRTSSSQLEIRGYIGISLFGRTEVWTR